MQPKLRFKNMFGKNLLLTILLGLIITVAVSLSFAYAETESVIVDGTSYDVTYDAMEITVLEVGVDLEFNL